MLNCQVFNFRMKSLNNRERKIRIFTPKNYDKKVKYPVIYMHDGQNLFDDDTASYGKSWNIANQFNNHNMEYIVVGIDSGEGILRMNELGPWRNRWIKDDKDFDFIKNECGGEGDEYLQFIVNELKPWVDANYTTLTDRNNTCIAGSSMGGLISLYGILKYPHIFSKAACLSSAFWFSEEHLIEFIRLYVPEFKLKIHLDFGKREVNDSLRNDYLVNFTKVINYKLIKKAIQSRFELIDNGVHNESSWEERFPGIIRWLYNKTDN